MVSCDETVEPLKKLSQVPDNIIPTKACPTLYSRIFELLPEYQNNELAQKILFADTVQKNVTLTVDSEVYLTFISEGASFHNTLGWYSYSSLTPPKSSKDFEWHILFPDVFDGILTSGDRLKLGDGKFKAGTVIGFFLIVNGWNQGTIDYTRTTHFTNHSLNVDQKQQHILFEEKTCGDIILSFEDMPLSNINSDHDFNDIIFTISDNNSNLMNTAFKKTNLVKQ
jgi:Domain of unknown function (DUF4114)